MLVLSKEDDDKLCTEIAIKNGAIRRSIKKLRVMRHTGFADPATLSVVIADLNAAINGETA